MRFTLMVVAVSVLVTGWLPTGASASGQFPSGTAIDVPDNADGSPYPAGVDVFGQGPITDVDVTLNGVSHGFSEDLDVVLVSPSGTAVVLMSDACADDEWLNANLRFDDEAIGEFDDLGICPTTTKPADFEPGDTWPGSGVSARTSTLSSFDGQNPNGTWSLYVRDDSAGISGTIASGWTLHLTTGAADLFVPANESTRAASRYPAIQQVSSRTGAITDVDVVIDGLSHSFPDDIELMLVSPAGKAVELMSDACGGDDVNDAVLRFDDEAPGPIPDDTVCASGSFRPAAYVGNEGTGDAPPPAPSTGGRALSSLDGTDPNGEWHLFVADDEDGDGGYITRGWRLEITTSPPRAAGFATSTVIAKEGSSVELTVTREGGTGIAGSIGWALRPGTATPGVDVLAAPSALYSFGPTETTKSLVFPVPADASGEPAETLTIELVDPLGDARIDPARRAVTITIPADPPRRLRRIGSSFQTQTARRRGRTLGVVTAYSATGLPSRAKVRLRCIAGCSRYLSRTKSASRSGQAVMRFARLPVRRSTTLEVRVTAPGFVAKLERYRFRVRNGALTAKRL